MSGSFSTVKYSGLTPGADANTYVLFATTLPAAPTDAQNAQWPQKGFALMGIHKVALALKNTQAGTLNAYESPDRGVTWNQVDTVAVAATAATASFLADYLVEGFADFKLEWVNGGAAQAKWDVMLALSDDRASAL